MSNGDPVYIASPIAGAITSVLAVAQAVLVVDKRLGRVAEVESQIGRLPRVVQWLYVWAQYAYRFAFVGIAIAGALGLVAFLFPQQLPWRPFTFLREHGLLLLVIWLVFGAIMYTNLLSWTGIAIALLAGRFDPTGSVLTGRHPAWHALRSFVAQNDLAKPIVVNQRSAVSFADTLVGLLRSAEPKNRAAAPNRPDRLDERTFRSQLSNGLLAGCVIEEAYYDLRLAAPEWGSFYAAIGDAAAETDVFSVYSIITHSSTESTTTRPAQAGSASLILQALNGRLAARGQAAVPDSAEIRDRLNATFRALASEYNGDAASIYPRRSWPKRRRLDTAYRRIARLPKPSTDAMRAQFVKLAVVWGVWLNASVVAFRFPFALRVAALLLDRDVIRAPEDVKVLAFEHPRERQVAEAAERMVVSHAIRLIESQRAEHERWLPAPSRALSGEPFRWWLTYELDVRLWGYALELHRNAGQADALARWKSVGGRAVRI
jgi:hypothetical protein